MVNIMVIHNDMHILFWNGHIFRDVGLYYADNKLVF